MRTVWRVAAWRRVLGGLCALGLLCVSLAACSAHLIGPPVTLANAPAHGINVPAEIRHGDRGATLAVVEAFIHGKGPYPMAVDTGASLSLIDSSLAQKLGLPSSGAPEDITGIGGSQRVTPVRIDNWSLGQAKLPSMNIASTPLPDVRRSAGVYGLLGSDLWDHFGAITIDYSDSQITIYQLTGGASSHRDMPSLAA